MADEEHTCPRCGNEDGTAGLWVCTMGWAQHQSRWRVTPPAWPDGQTVEVGQLVELADPRAPHVTHHYVAGVSSSRFVTLTTGSVAYLDHLTLLNNGAVLPPTGPSDDGRH